MEKFLEELEAGRASAFNALARLEEEVAAGRVDRVQARLAEEVEAGRRAAGRAP